MSLYHYAANLVRVIDGDTIVADVDLGMRVWLRDVRLRLLGIDCPEIGTPAGVLAAQATRGWLDDGETPRPFYMISDKDRTEPHGRWLATIYRDDTFASEPLNHWLVANGHAVPYPAH